MEKVRCHLLLVIVLVAAVNSQSYPRFEFRGDALVNNSFIVRGAPVHIGEGHNDSLHCMTDNSDCCSNGKGNWYNVTGGEVQQRSDGNSSLYVTRGYGVNRRTGGSSGMWRCDIPDSNGVQQSIFIYLGTPMTGVWLCLWCFLPHSAGMCTGNLSSAVITFTLESEANEDPPEFTLTCQSRGGPVTEVEWRRNGVRVEEDSNHMTSQIIVDTSRNTVYNNTLRVRGRERGLYVCSISNNRHEYVQGASATGPRATERVQSELTWQTMKCHLLNFISVPQKPTSLNATYKTPTSISLEWTFNITLSFEFCYVIYYQSRDGVSHSVAFTTDSREDHTHELTGLPVGGIHSISLVALIDLPSPVVGPVTPGEHIVANLMHFTTLWIFSC